MASLPLPDVACRAGHRILSGCLPGGATLPAARPYRATLSLIICYLKVAVNSCRPFIDKHFYRGYNADCAEDMRCMYTFTHSFCIY